MSHLLRQLIPLPCILCEQNQINSSGFCEPCLNDLPWLTKACPYCAIPWRLHRDSLGCPSPRHSIDRCTAVFEDTFPLPQLMMQIKQQAFLAAGRALAVCLAQAISTYPASIEALVPIPSSRRALRRRGYNPALEISRTVGQILKIPVVDHWLGVSDAKRDQKHLPRADRLRPKDNSFHAKRPCKATHLVIIDDVMTTLSTINQVARLFKAQGVQQVDAWAVCSTLPPPPRPT